MSEASPSYIGGSRVSVTAPGHPNLYAGAVLVVLALIVLGISFYHPGPIG